MSYQVLARKWRPRSFAAMVGQEHVLRALVNALDNDRLHHAYLFTGTRGVGKTTVARILAKALNCEAGVGSQPCGECTTCREIDEGRFVDLIEVDAASRTKVEDTRELLDNVQYAPTRGRYKVYLIDEVHMLSSHSFNALLKTLEEPPPHVKFLLATTDPQKLPVTILSRCLQFNLRRLDAGAIRDHLAHILGEEGIEHEPASLELLARAADGSMRDALSLLDQAIAYGGGAVREAEVRAMLGTIEDRHVEALLSAVAAGDAPALFRAVEALAQGAPDFGGVLDALLGTLHAVAVMQQVPEAWDEGMGEREMLEALAAAMAPEDVQLYYQIALTGRRDLPLAPDPRTGFEMTMLRMLAFRPAGTEAGTAGGGDLPAQRSTPAAPAAATAGPGTRAAVPAAEAGSPAAAGGLAAEWQALAAALPLRGAARQLAMHCVLVERDGSRWRFRVDGGATALNTPERVARLEEALSAHVGSEVRVQIETGDGETATEESPAAREARESAERQARAEAAIAEDANVRVLLETFDGQVRPGSVRPLD